MLMKDEIQALAWTVRRYAEFLPPENRNAAKNGAMQPAFDKVRMARGALKKLRAAAAKALDGCEFCLGAKGGVPGNENRIGGHVVCDYCTPLATDIQRAKEKGNG